MKTNVFKKKEFRQGDLCMVNYKRVSAGISHEDYALAKSLGLNISEVLREAIKLRADSTNDLPALIEKRDKTMAIVKYYDNEIEKKQKLLDDRSQVLGNREELIQEKVGLMQNIFKRTGRIGDDMIMSHADDIDVPFEELVMNLPVEVQNSRVKRMRKDKADIWKH